MKYTKPTRWNPKITKFVESIGGEESLTHVGFYFVNRKEIDLSASGNEGWQITKNILEQI